MYSLTITDERGHILSMTACSVQLIIIGWNKSLTLKKLKG